MASLRDIIRQQLRRDDTGDEVVLSRGLRLRYVMKHQDDAPPTVYIAVYRLVPQAPSQQEMVTVFNTLKSALNADAPLDDEHTWQVRRSRIMTKTITVDGRDRTAKGYHLTWEVAPVAQPELLDD